MKTWALWFLLLLSRAGWGDPCRELVVAIQRRLELSRLVAAYKWSHHLPIEDPAREQALLASLPNERTRRFMRWQIEASKQLQVDLFDQWQEQPPQSQTPPDLQQLRRQLDQATAEIQAALEHLPCEGWQSSARALWGDDPPDWVETALEPLRHQQ